MPGPTLAIREQCPNATAQNDGLMTADQASQSTATADVLINVATTGNDSSFGGPLDPVLTVQRALTLLSGWWRLEGGVQFAAGTYVLPTNLSIALGGPVGGAAIDLFEQNLFLLGGFTNELGNRSASAGTTNKTIQDSTLSASFRSGLVASVASVAGFGTIPGTMTVTGMTGLTSADVGKAFKFIGVNGGNCGTFTMKTFVSATSATFLNPQAVAEAGTLYWQDSWEGGFISFTSTTATVALQGTRRQIGKHGVASTGSLRPVAGASLIDGETFTLTILNTDGTTTVTVYEFDSNGSVTPGNIAVTFTAGDSIATVTASMIAAIVTQASTQLVRVGRGIDSSGNIIVSLENKMPGVAGNVAITDTVANAGFVVTGMTGGLGTPTTSFTVAGAAAAVFPATPAVGDTFVIEQPNVILQYPGTLNISGGASTYFAMQGIKLQATTSSSILHLQGAFNLLAEGCEWDLGGFAPSTGSIFQDVLSAVRGQGVGLSRTLRNCGIHIHDGTWTVGANNSRVTNIFVTRNLQITVNSSEARFVQAQMDRTTIIGQEAGRFGLNACILDGSVFAADAAVVDLDILSEMRVTTNSTIKGGVRGIRLRNGSQATLSSTTGTFNSRVGMTVDYASHAVIDSGATSSLSGTNGEVELGHPTAPAYFPYGLVAGAASGAIRFADGSGVKGQADAYLNRVDV